MGIIFLTYAEMGHGDMLIQQVMGILDAKIDGNILMMFKVAISMRIFDVYSIIISPLVVDGNGCNQWG